MTANSTRSFRWRLYPRPNPSSGLPNIDGVIRLSRQTLWAGNTAVTSLGGSRDREVPLSHIRLPPLGEFTTLTYAASWLPALTGTLPAGEGVKFYRRSK